LLRRTLVHSKILVSQEVVKAQISIEYQVIFVPVVRKYNCWRQPRLTSSINQNDMQKASRENIVGVSIFIVLLIAFGLWYTAREKTSYKSRGKITTGLVHSFKYDYKGRLYLNYAFKVNGREYKQKAPFPEFAKGAEKALLNRAFPVIYIEDDPEKSELLISKASYDRLNMQFPDTLEWTRRLEFP
jgi:hypothetical protein